ncbi:MAG: COX15/CtaA family protein [Gammaproteobacteria bacterium]|nr:COX15/CtaA family protein [Gammaproteobacteria bacterium]
MKIWYQRLCVFACLLALVVVVMGAWVRLSDAGLGCPDWPGCYGSLVVPSAADAVAEAEEAFPQRPLEANKAWREMVHRYAASTLGFAIMLIALLAWRNRKEPQQPVKVPVALFFLVCFQGLLGMWTVTLLLKPLIVMGHLLGGLSTLGLLFWSVCENRYPNSSAKQALPKMAVIALMVLVLQIGLGGWTSSNYAALACPDLPTCQGQWWPEQVDFAEGFVMWRGLGVNYEFGILEAPARVAIHFTHRLGAIIAFLVIGLTAVKYLRAAINPRVSAASMFVLIALVSQISLGLAAVWFGLPLIIATGHNLVAALLLLSVINLNHAVLRSGV